MTAKAGYAVALHQSDWEAEFFAQLAAEFQIRGELKRCVDLADLIADALAGLVQTVIVDVDFAGLDATTISRIASRANVIGLCSSLDGDSRLRQWGIHEVVLLAPGESQHAVRSVIDVVARLEAKLPVSDNLSDVPDSLLGLGFGSDDLADSAGSRPGRKILVWGPTAGSGITTVATGLAETLAREYGSTTLIDADLESPSIAETLALTNDSGGLLRTCRLAERGTLTATELAATSWALGDALRFLPGVTAVHRKPEIKPVALGRVLEVAATLDSHVVVDLGAPWLPASPMVDGRELEYVFAAQDEARTALLSELQAGDVVVAVVDCSPVAIARATTVIGQVAKLMPEAALVIVVNRIRKSVLGASELGEVSELFRRAVPQIDVTVIAVRYDLETADKALLSGQTFIETNPGSPAATDLGSIACHLGQRVEIVGASL